MKMCGLQWVVQFITLSRLNVDNFDCDSLVTSLWEVEFLNWGIFFYIPDEVN